MGSSRALVIQLPEPVQNVSPTLTLVPIFHNSLESQSTDGRFLGAVKGFGK